MKKKIGSHCCQLKNEAYGHKLFSACWLAGTLAVCCLRAAPCPCILVWVFAGLDYGAIGAGICWRNACTTTDGVRCTGLLLGGHCKEKCHLGISLLKT